MSETFSEELDLPPVWGVGVMVIVDGFFIERIMSIKMLILNCIPSTSSNIMQFIVNKLPVMIRFFAQS